eukprot:7185836-Pyramimonas_sp.AAC.2
MRNGEGKLGVLSASSPLLAQEDPSKEGMFPQLQCYGFGSAAASTLDLSRALAPHCTSVVLGNDF